MGRGVQSPRAACSRIGRRPRAAGPSATARRTRSLRSSVDELGDRRLELRERPIPGRPEGSGARAGARLPVPRDDAGEDFRAADVHSIAFVAVMCCGYRNPPNGRLRGKAVPRLQRRAHKGKSSARKRDRTTYKSGGGGGGSEKPVVAPPRALAGRGSAGPGYAPRPLHPSRDLVGRRLPGRLERRCRREQAPPRRHDGRPPEAELAHLLLEHEHPAPRHRPLGERPAGTQLRPALGFDDVAPHRPEPPPARLSLDPARPARDDPRLRRPESECRDADRRPEARDRDCGCPLRARPPGQSRRRRRHGRVRVADRRGRRNHRERAGEHPVRQVRLPLLGDALRELERLALPEGRTAHERAPRAHLLSRPRQPAQPVRFGHQPGCASAAGSPAAMQARECPARSSGSRSAAAI